jgi:thiol-disulfide isomerase/thioredoxin
MNHSSYFYGAMELYRDKGQRALKSFFAEAGITPKDYSNLYSEMALPIRKQLPKKFKEHGRTCGLTENRMFLQQFVRETGLLEVKNALFLHDLSCIDASQVITALLSSVPASLSGARLESLPQTADGSTDYDAVNERERQVNVENFWRAFDCVLCKEPAPLLEGIAEAVEMAKAVQTMARLLKESKAMHSTRLFRWCKIEHPPHVFRHHLSVRRLAVWLLHVLFTYRPKGETGGDRPLLVIVRDRVRDTYLCVGATPSKVAEQDEFGNKFRSVLQTDSFKCRYDFFDKSCIEVAADDFDRFWDILCELDS